MDDGEYIEFCQDENRFWWWDEFHRGHWSYPQDVSDDDYRSWIQDEWVVCNDIQPKH